MAAIAPRSGWLVLLATAPLRKWIRALRSRRTSLPIIAKIGLTALMLPAFAALVIPFRLRAVFFGPVEVQVRTENGDIFICHPPDLIQLYLWLFDVWEPDLTHFMSERLRGGDGFVDVGANIGYFSVLASSGVGANGQVVAIEASPIVFAAMQETLHLNPHCGNVRALNTAAAAVPGEITVYAGPAHNIGLTTTVRERGMPAQATVHARPLDQLLRGDEIRRARIIKIDVEGAEDIVLDGMRAMLRNTRDDLEILVELSPTWWSDRSRRPIDVLRPFLDAGFHAYQIDNSYWPWRYLWPNAVKRPARIRHDLTKRVGRLDVVLSKLDHEQL